MPCYSRRERGDEVMSWLFVLLALAIGGLLLVGYTGKDL